jgi:hypothetical protein
MVRVEGEIAGEALAVTVTLNEKASWLEFAQVAKIM